MDEEEDVYTMFGRNEIRNDIYIPIASGSSRTERDVHESSNSWIDVTTVVRNDSNAWNIQLVLMGIDLRRTVQGPILTGKICAHAPHTWDTAHI